MLNTSQYAKYFRVVTVLLLLATFSGCGTIKASRKILPPHGSGGSGGGATQTTPDGMHEISGVASWYGGKFHGRQTANGERFNKNGISAAHQTLPFGTVVRVKNMRNGKTVDVRINDRGPFVKGRIIDLSKGAAEKIDMVIDGVVPVELTILHLGNG